MKNEIEISEILLAASGIYTCLNKSKIIQGKSLTRFCIVGWVDYFLK